MNKMFRKFAQASTKPIGGLIFTAVIVNNASKNQDTPTTVVQGVELTDPEQTSYIRKPSELPLYTPIHSHLQTATEPKLTNKPTFRDGVESVVRIFRTEAQSGYTAISDQVKVMEDYVDTAKSHSQQAIDYLNEPQNTLPRAGAIGVGGLAGFILASRGGFIRKVFYSAIGAGLIASLCYPEDAEHYAREALYEARRNYTIASNFILGVKPGDEQAEKPINFPTNIEDLKLLVLDLYDEAIAIFVEKKK